VFTPRYEGARGDCYPFSGEGRLDPVLGGLIARPTAHNTMVTPGGYSEGWNTSLTFSIAGAALAA
jgi:hypothetical protein